MNWTEDQIAAVVGMKELELIGLRMQLAQALARIKELESTTEKTDLAAIEGCKA